MQQTYDLLSHLGAASSYKGYHYLAYIIDRIVAQNNEPTPFRIKDFYVDAAQHYHTSPDSIQQGIRTFLRVYWAYGNGENFRRITGYKGTVPLPPKDFIAMLVDYHFRHPAGNKRKPDAKRT